MLPRHIFMAVLVSAIAGANLVAIKLGLQQFPPFMLSTLRFSLILLLFFPYLRIARGQMVKVLAIAVFAGALHFAATFVGLSMARDASAVAIAVQLNVPFATILAVIFLGERVHSWRIAGIFLSFAGAIVLGFAPHVFSYVDALLVIAFAAFVYAIGAVIMRQVRGVGVFQLQAWVALVSAPFLFSMSLLTEPGAWHHLPEITTLTMGSVLYSTFGASIIGHGGIYYLLQRYPVAVVSPFFLLAPVFGVTFAVLILHDVLTLQMVLGGLITLSGISIITLRERRQTTPAVEEPIPVPEK